MRVDTGAIVPDDELGGSVPALGLDGDRSSLWSVRERIVNQDTHDLCDPIGVGLGRCGTVAVDLDRGPVAVGRRPELLRDPSRKLNQVDPLGVELEYVSVELREVQEVGG